MRKPLELYNLLKTQDCWLRIPNMIPMKNDPSSKMDELSLEGSFGGFHLR
jgi:hypothetical protein